MIDELADMNILTSKIGRFGKMPAKQAVLSLINWVAIASP